MNFNLIFVCLLCKWSFYLDLVSYNLTKLVFIDFLCFLSKMSCYLLIKTVWVLSNVLFFHLLTPNNKPFTRVKQIGLSCGSFRREDLDCNSCCKELLGRPKCDFCQLWWSGWECVLTARCVGGLLDSVSLAVPHHSPLCHCMSPWSILLWSLYQWAVRSFTF